MSETFILDRIKELHKCAVNLELDNTKPLKYFMILVFKLDDMATTAVLHGFYERAFLIASRLLLVLSKYIPKHPEYENGDISTMIKIRSLRQKFERARIKIIRIIYKKFLKEANGKPTTISQLLPDTYSVTQNEFKAYDTLSCYEEAPNLESNRSIADFGMSNRDFFEHSENISTNVPYNFCYSTKLGYQNDSFESTDFSVSTVEQGQRLLAVKSSERKIRGKREVSFPDNMLHPIIDENRVHLETHYYEPKSWNYDCFNLGPYCDSKYESDRNANNGIYHSAGSLLRHGNIHKSEDLSEFHMKNNYVEGRDPENCLWDVFPTQKSKPKRQEGIDLYAIAEQKEFEKPHTIDGTHAFTTSYNENVKPEENYSPSAFKLNRREEQNTINSRSLQGNAHNNPIYREIKSLLVEAASSENSSLSLDCSSYYGEDRFLVNESTVYLGNCDLHEYQGPNLVQNGNLASHYQNTNGISAKNSEKFGRKHNKKVETELSKLKDPALLRNKSESDCFKHPQHKSVTRCDTKNKQTRLINHSKSNNSDCEFSEKRDEHERSTLSLNRKKICSFEKCDRKLGISSGTSISRGRFTNFVGKNNDGNAIKLLEKDAFKTDRSGVNDKKGICEGVRSAVLGAPMRDKKKFAHCAANNYHGTSLKLLESVDCKSNLLKSNDKKRACNARIDCGTSNNFITIDNNGTLLKYPENMDCESNLVKSDDKKRFCKARIDCGTSTKCTTIDNNGTSLKFPENVDCKSYLLKSNEKKRDYNAQIDCGTSTKCTTIDNNGTSLKYLENMDYESNLVKSDDKKRVCKARIDYGTSTKCTTIDNNGTLLKFSENMDYESNLVESNNKKPDYNARIDCGISNEATVDKKMFTFCIIIDNNGTSLKLPENVDYESNLVKSNDNIRVYNARIDCGTSNNCITIDNHGTSLNLPENMDYEPNLVKSNDKIRACNAQIDCGTSNNCITNDNRGTSISKSNDKEDYVLDTAILDTIGGYVSKSSFDRSFENFLDYQVSKNIARDNRMNCSKIDVHNTEDALKHHENKQRTDEYQNVIVKVKESGNRCLLKAPRICLPEDTVTMISFYAGERSKRGVDSYAFLCGRELDNEFIVKELLTIHATDINSDESSNEVRDIKNYLGRNSLIAVGYVHVLATKSYEISEEEVKIMQKLCYDMDFAVIMLIAVACNNWNMFCATDPMNSRISDFRNHVEELTEFDFMMKKSIKIVDLCDVKIIDK